MEEGGVFRPLFWYGFSIVSFLSTVIFDTESLYATSFAIKLDFKGKQTFFITNAPLLQKLHIFYISKRSWSLSEIYSPISNIPIPIFLYVLHKDS